MAFKLIQSFSVYNNQSVQEYEMKLHIYERYEFTPDSRLYPVTLSLNTDD